MEFPDWVQVKEKTLQQQVTVWSFYVTITIFCYNVQEISALRNILKI